MTIYSYNKTEQQARTYGNSWGRIFGKPEGSIYLIPSEAEETILQLEPFIRISCVLAEKTRDLRFSYLRSENKTSEIPIRTPKLLLTNLLYARPARCGDYRPCLCINCLPKQHNVLCGCATCVSYRKYNILTANNLYIFALTEKKIDEKNSHFYLKSFNFANVYPQEGKICFGLQKLPTNLRHASNNFWGSAFNNDFKTLTFDHSICENKSRHGYAGHSYSQAAHAGYCRKDVKHTCECDCRNKGRHQPSCKFYKGCRCPCACNCCKGACKCPCNCGCCRKVCSCSCDCDFNDEFAFFLQKEVDNTWGFKDSTYDIFGSKHIRIKQKIDGIFYSHEPNILKKIDSKYHRKDTAATSNVQRDYVVGTARSIPDNDWEITLEDGQIILLCDKEVTFT